MHKSDYTNAERFRNKYCVDIKGKISTPKTGQ
jgi:hypothetical protein